MPDTPEPEEAVSRSEPAPLRSEESYVIPWKPPGSRAWLFTTKARLPYHTIADFAPSNALLMSHSLAWEPIIEDIIRHVDVPVFLVSEDQDGEASLNLALQRWGRGIKQQIHSLAYDVDSAWVRDYGPIQQASVATGRIRWLDANYHADRTLDDRLPAYLSRMIGVPRKRFSRTMEGGALVSNGRGLCASTEEYVVHSGLYLSLRSTKTRDRVLADLGCKTLVLVPALPDEETRHVDLILQFVGPSRMIVGQADASKWPRLSSLLRVAEQRMLKAARVHGMHLRSHRVSIPKVDKEVYYTYVNGIRVNGRFLVPSFSEISMEEEERAFAQLAKAMPNTDIVPIDVRELPQYQGLLHCIALGLKLPKVALNRLHRPKSRKPRRSKRPVRT